MIDTKSKTPARYDFKHTLDLKAKIKLDQETGAWVAYCKKLDLYSQGSTYQEAKRAIRSAAALYVRARLLAKGA